MEREVRYCTSFDGTRIAYSIAGEGSPIVWIPGWISHLEIDHQLSESMGILQYSARHLWIQMDKRGGGLSGRNISDLSLEARVRDVEAVVEDAGIDKFALGGHSEGGPIAIAYAARHPEKVTKLIILGSFANGAGLAGTPQMRDAVIAITKAEWGMASKVMAELFVGENSIMSIEAFAAYQRTCANAQDAVGIIEAAVSIDVRPLLSQINVPTLVIHTHEDRIVPIELGQEIAAGIKGARFVSLNGAHIMGPEGFQKAFAALSEFVGYETREKRPAADQTSGFKTILFTDLVGHTAMMRRLGDEKGRAVLREHETVTRDVLKQHSGSEVKTMGDGFMASFPSVTKGVECAIALQKAFAERNESAEEPLTIRVGLNAGEPIEEDGDLFGETVIMAARIAAMAQGGEILSSLGVRELCGGKGFLFADRGEHVMRGFEDPVRVFDISWQN
ncbi:MAG: adenylate/guanylate cyclase domain-containing protein [Chloroflexota bacterium]